MEETVKQRLMMFKDYLGIGQAKFEKLAGLSNGYLNQLRNAPGAVKLQSIIYAFPELNKNWLLTGEGNMLNSPAEENAALPFTSVPSTPVISQSIGQPYYDVDFIGGFDLVLNNQAINPEYNIDFRPYNKPGVIWCNITGHSMEPKISHGDIIAIKEVSDWQNYLTYGEIYAIVTQNELRTVKIIRKASQEANFRLVPINTSQYDEQEIPKTMVLKVFEVLGCMKKI